MGHKNVFNQKLFHARFFMKIVCIYDFIPYLPQRGGGNQPFRKAQFKKSLIKRKVVFQ